MIVLIGEFIEGFLQVIEACGEPELLVFSDSLSVLIANRLGKVENLLQGGRGSSVLLRKGIRPLALGKKRNEQQS